MMLEEFLQVEKGVPDSLLQRLLERLIEDNVVTQDQQGSWLLKCNLDSYSLMDLYRSGHFHLPLGREFKVTTYSPWDSAFFNVLDQDVLNLEQSLTSLYSQEEPVGQ